MTVDRPSPGFPDPLSPLLALIVQGALENLDSGETNAEGAILQAAEIFTRHEDQVAYGKNE
jgi:hypothetical protein